MDAKETEVASGAGAVDAAALAKAALATVMKTNNEKEKAVEKVEVTTPSVEALQAELAALKAKMASPAASKPSKEEKAAAKAAAKEAAAKAKADAKAAKAAAKATKPTKAAAKAAAAAEKKAAREQKKAEKLAAKNAAKEAKAAAKAEKLKAKADAKAAKKAAKSDKPTPSTGQSGPAIKDLTADDLNDKETAIMLALGTEGHRTEKTIKALADECFPNKKKAQANSWVRNGLRRLVRAKFLEKDGRGVFKHTVDGRNVAKKLEESKSAKK